MKTPKHLENCTFISKEKEYNLVLTCRCKCGCSTFTSYINTLSKEEQKVVNELNKQNPLNSGFKTLHVETDKNGNHKWYYKYLFGLIKKEIHIPQYPFYAKISVAKIQCCNCNTQYIIYDNRYNGYDAGIDTPSDEEKNYQVEYKKLSENCSVTINLEYADDIEEPNDFISIDIYTRNSNNKKKLLLSEETG